MKKVNSILFFTSLCVMFSCGLINDSSENSDDNKPMISAVKSRLMGLSLNKVEDLLGKPDRSYSNHHFYKYVYYDAVIDDLDKKSGVQHLSVTFTGKYRYAVTDADCHKRGSRMAVTRMTIVRLP